MSLTIPLRGDLPDYDFQVELENITYGLRLRLNQRDGGWYLDVSNAEGTVLASSVRLVLNTELLRRYPDPRLPPGRLVVISTTSDATDPGPTDLTSRVRLIYIPSV